MLYQELCKSGWTDWDAIWVMNSGGPKEPRIRWSSAVQKWLNWSICHLGCGLGSAEGSTSSIVFARGANVPSCEGTFGATWLQLIVSKAVYKRWEARMSRHLGFSWPINSSGRAQFPGWATSSKLSGKHKVQKVCEMYHEFHISLLRILGTMTFSEVLIL